MYVEQCFEKFSLTLLARMGEKFSRGDVTLGDSRLLCESICEYQMYLAAKNESLSPAANKSGGGHGS
ncbi:hypothetical protein [Thalassomonas sp. RHCl1]|uniref:hypothetical protein n=1 Tax=Thalassomonas sp. RHCl1 TaxID=2995320 RepID=UPI00248D31C9|nr:hypothetical protein [Thalassomonas sp. RHCl1]